MKKWMFIVLAGIMMTTVSFTGISASVQAAEEKAPAPPEKSLTDAQKTELEAMHKDVLQREKAIIHKYVEYGVMTKETGDMILEHMDKRFEKVKENGYVPPRHFGKMPIPHHKPESNTTD